MSEKKLLTLVGGVFAFVGLLFLAIGLFLAKRQVTIIRSWPEADATVTRSQVLHYTKHDSDSSTDTTMYKTEVTFQYRVGPREYNTPSQSDYASSSYKEMKHKADAFPVGSRQTIKYDPDDPYDVRFTAGYTWGFFFLPLIFSGLGGLFAAIGAVIVKIALRRALSGKMDSLSPSTC